jgi:hypothetical protein
MTLHPTHRSIIVSAVYKALVIPAKAESSLDSGSHVLGRNDAGCWRILASRSLHWSRVCRELLETSDALQGMRSQDAEARGLHLAPCLFACDKISQFLD